MAFGNNAVGRETVFAGGETKSSRGLYVREKSEKAVEYTAPVGCIIFAENYFVGNSPTTASHGVSFAEEGEGALAIVLMYSSRLKVIVFPRLFTETNLAHKLLAYFIGPKL